MTDWTDACSVLAFLRQGPAFREAGLVGTPGYTVPAFRNPLDLDLAAPDAATRLKARGIEIDARPGTHNRIVIEADVTGLGLRLVLNGTRDNTILIAGQRQILRGAFQFEGHGNTVVCGEAGTTSCAASAVLRSTEAGLFIGRGTTAGGVNLWLEGTGTSLILGDDCMLSWGIRLLLADGHGMIDLRERAVLNTPRSIVVEPHVWIAQDALVMRGVCIGAGSIVGARAVVTRSVPRAAVVAGAPARVLRRDVSWTRQAAPSAEQIDALFALPLTPDPVSDALIAG
jgi:hypothetical protein